jgi:hypothetical protein
MTPKETGALWTPTVRITLAEGSGVLAGSDAAPSGASLPPWSDEIQFETLAAGTFNVGASRLTFYETAFFTRRAGRSLSPTP